MDSIAFHLNFIDYTYEKYYVNKTNLPECIFVRNTNNKQYYVTKYSILSKYVLAYLI